MPTPVLPFGAVRGRPAQAYRLDGGAGVLALVTDFGARLVQLHVPDRDGVTADVVLGFDDAAGYEASGAYFGATVGRHANRLGDGRFELDGVEHQLDRNEGQNHLHGGRDGWERQTWAADPVADGRSITFRLASPDGEMGYPGTVEAACTYALEGAILRIVMEAVTDRPTIVNMVQHAYFNLAGHASGTILGQELRLDADHYLPVGEGLLPTGEVLAVAGTPFDFREPRPIGEAIDAVPGGYDHNWCLRGIPGADGLAEAAEIHDPASGRTLRLRTSEPGVQVYVAGYLDGTDVGKAGVAYPRFAGVTLETQAFPSAPRFRQFPSSVLRPGTRYRHEMVLDLTPS
ncbi:MAG TPA: aldose epimerase family protein [Candidatus Limnocylindrales bacterium]|nr:aldose epimerase family protein [Candidatus Limnocylindrales bacterium]